MHPKLTQDSLKAIGKNLGPSYRLSVADAEKWQLLWHHVFKSCGRRNDCSIGEGSGTIKNHVVVGSPRESLLNVYGSNSLRTC